MWPNPQETAVFYAVVRNKFLEKFWVCFGWSFYFILLLVKIVENQVLEIANVLKNAISLLDEKITKNHFPIVCLNLIDVV